MSCDSVWRSDLQEHIRKKQEVCRSLIQETEHNLRLLFQNNIPCVVLEIKCYSEFEAQLWRLPEELSTQIRDTYSKIREENDLIGLPDDGGVFFRRNDLWSLLRTELTQLVEKLKRYDATLKTEPSEILTENEEKKIERSLLLRRILDGQSILAIGRELQEPYSMRFGETGYNKDYKYYDEGLAANSVGNIITDAQLLAFCQRYNDKLKPYRDFFGKHYTYNAKQKQLRVETTWPSFERKLENLRLKHGIATYAVVKAYLDLREDYETWSACDYNRLAYRAKEIAGNGWKQALIGLEVEGVIEKRGGGKRPGERSIQPELIPLVEKVLSGWEKEQPTMLSHTALKSAKTEFTRQRGSIFLSHSHADSQFCRRLANDLQERGIRVWIDEAEMQVGDSLIEKISRAIAEMDYVAVVLSANSVKSRWVMKEVAIAMTKEIKGRRVKVLPLLLEECSIPTFLQDKVYADFRQPSKYEQELDRIVKRVSIISAPSPSKALQTRASSELTMQEAKEIALEHVKRERPVAMDIVFDSTELKEGRWYVSGHWTEAREASFVTTHFVVVVDASTKTITKYEFKPGFAAAFI